MGGHFRHPLNRRAASPLGDSLAGKGHCAAIIILGSRVQPGGQLIRRGQLFLPDRCGNPAWLDDRDVQVPGEQLSP